MILERMNDSNKNPRREAFSEIGSDQTIHISNLWCPQNLAWKDHWLLRSVHYWGVGGGVGEGIYGMILGGINTNNLILTVK